jgi:hypothetical protein
MNLTLTPWSIVAIIALLAGMVVSSITGKSDAFTVGAVIALLIGIGHFAMIFFSDNGDKPV